VLGEGGLFFSTDSGKLAAILAGSDDAPARLRELGEQACARATALYRWDAVAAAYAGLFRALADAADGGRALRRGEMPEFYRPAEFAAAPARAADGVAE